MGSREAKVLTPISKAGKSNNQKGFTLIELAVVVILLSLFAVFTVPLFSSTGTSDLGYSARRLNGTIKYLYNETVLTGREHRLIFNLDRRSYQARLVEETGEVVNAPGMEHQAILSGDVKFRDLQIPGVGTVATGEVALVFNPSGWVQEALIHLQGGEEQLTLQIMPLTGTTEIHDGYELL